jgi:hypothetical protein
MRRVVASSDSRSGNRRANAVFCLLELLDLLVLLVAFLAALLALPAFFFDLVGFLDDLERADFLAMIDFE